MATILQLVLAGELDRYDPQLRRGQQLERAIYASQRLKNWMLNDLPGLVSDRQVEQSPREQVDARLAVFCSGGVISYTEHLHEIGHVKDGVWEIKTADVRIFGWFHARDCFIGHIADTKHRILEHHLYYGYSGEVVRFRNALDLDEPKFIIGSDPKDVISNFAFSNP